MKTDAYYYRRALREGLIGIAMICVVLAYGAACNAQAAECNREDFPRGWPITEHACGEPGSGKHWDLRHWLLFSQALPDTVETREVSGKTCIVLSGEWLDTYRGMVWKGDADRLHVDHRVPLAEACREGAGEWSTERRAEYYRDIGNLVLTLDKVNMKKSDRDVGGQWHLGRTEPWWPPDPSARCSYADAWLDTKMKYDLSSDHDELEALVKMSWRCQAEPVASCREAFEVLENAMAGVNAAMDVVLACSSQSGSVVN